MLVSRYRARVNLSRKFSTSYWKTSRQNVLPANREYNSCNNFHCWQTSPHSVERSISNRPEGADIATESTQSSPISVAPLSLLLSPLQPCTSDIETSVVCVSARQRRRRRHYNSVCVGAHLAFSMQIGVGSMLRACCNRRRTGRELESPRRVGRRHKASPLTVDVIWYLRCTLTMHWTTSRQFPPGSIPIGHFPLATIVDANTFCTSVFLSHFYVFNVFTALHVMQTRYCDENAVRLSVRLSVCLSHACIVTKR